MHSFFEAGGKLRERAAEIADLVEAFGAFETAGETSAAVENRQCLTT